MLFRIDEQGDVMEVAATTTRDENVYEEQVEAWIARRPEMLGEPLLIIGRQVEMDGGRDRIDLLAIDQDGSLVVIELKRDLIGGSADLQALRYAALAADWSEADVQRQAEGYWESLKMERDFRDEIEKLCGEEASVNSSQRIVLAGRDIKPRLGSMALWLIRQGIDLKVVAIALLRDGDRLYAQPQVVLPPPTEQSLVATVAVGSSKKPWLVDGRAWHLEQRCGPTGRKITEKLVSLIAEAVPDAEGPSWSQKYYVSWKFASNGWIRLQTGSTRAVLNLTKCSVPAAAAAQDLDLPLFEEEAELSEKLAIGSSVGPLPDGLRLRIKSAEDLDDAHRADALRSLLQRSWIEFTGQPESVGTLHPGSSLPSEDGAREAASESTRAD